MSYGLYVKYVMNPSHAVDLELSLIRSILHQI